MTAPRDLATLARFALVGTATAAIYTGAFAGLSALAVPTIAGNLLAYGLAILFQFFGHRDYTFSARGSLPAMAARFLTTNAAGLALSSALALALRDGAGLGAAETGVAISAILAAMNWVVMRRWVFR